MRGTHFVKTHDLDVTDSTQITFDHWLHQYDEDINDYLETVNQN